MILIIGAGISGLTAAWYLQKAGLDYELLEAGNIPGGYMQTLRTNGLILEQGPNSILCDADVLEFIHATGAGPELIEANPVSKSRYILKNGKYRKLPGDPLSLLFGSFFSTSTKIKVLTEPFRKTSENSAETLDSFFTRRFGREIADYALNPFISGIYSGDPGELLLEETFPSLKEYEEKYGSVLKGFIRNKPARRGSYSFKYGMATLPIKIAAGLKKICYGHKVTEVIRKNGKLMVSGQNENGEKFEKEASALVITAPAFAASGFLKSLNPGFAEALSKIDYPPICAVHTVYEKKSVHYDLNGFGALHPSVENRFTLGSIWSSSVFSGRCPEDQVLFTSMVGGMLHAHNAEVPEGEIKKKVHEELAHFYNISSAPVFQHFVKWEKSIPQYNSKLKSVRTYISGLEKENVFICANWVDGVSLSDCIRKGKNIADKFFKLQ